MIISGYWGAVCELTLAGFFVWLYGLFLPASPLGMITVVGLAACTAGAIEAAMGRV